MPNQYSPSFFCYKDSIKIIVHRGLIRAWKNNGEQIILELDINEIDTFINE